MKNRITSSKIVKNGPQIIKNENFQQQNCFADSMSNWAYMPKNVFVGRMGWLVANTKTKKKLRTKLSIVLKNTWISCFQNIMFLWQKLSTLGEKHDNILKIVKNGPQIIKNEHFQQQNCFADSMSNWAYMPKNVFVGRMGWLVAHTKTKKKTTLNKTFHCT